MTTQQLTEIVCEARDFTSKRAAGAKLHPAARTFQALRMLVNRELGNLQRLLDIAPTLLEPGGVIAVVSFHSGEDRLVKQSFRRWSDVCTCPPGLPVCICGQVPLGTTVPHRAMTAGADEVARNPRARSAKLRIFRVNDAT